MTTLIKVCTTPTESLEALRKLCSWAREIRLAYAWASSEDEGGDAAHWQALPLEKVTRATIGISFASTDPRVLQQFFACGPDVLRVVADTIGVFHPKVIVGFRDKEAQALLGSSNFTSGGFQSNTELNVWLSGDLDESPLIDIIGFVDAQWRNRMARTLTTDWLERYAEAYQSRPPPQPVPPLPPARLPPPPPFIQRRALLRPPPLRNADQLFVQWADYFRMIQSREGQRLANGNRMYVFGQTANGSYLREAEQCQRLFRQHGSLAAMPEENRKFVAGFGGTSGYFGSMRPAGNFKNLVIESPRELSMALDKIPDTDAVSVDHARAFLDEALSIHGVSLATATRMLVTKRPDSFISLNSASRRRIKEVFKTAPTRAEPYLKLLAQIWEYPWVQSDPPRDRQQLRVWNARVALLDALMYEPQ